MGLGPRTQRYRHWSLVIYAPRHDTHLCMANFLDSTVPSATKTYKLNHGVRYIYVLLVSIVLARFHWISEIVRGHAVISAGRNRYCCCCSAASRSVSDGSSCNRSAEHTAERQSL